MLGHSYLELLEIILRLDFQLLCPWREVKGRFKPRKLFRALFLSSLSLVLIMTSFVYFEWDTLSMATIAANVATALVYIRSCFYPIAVKKFYSEYTNQTAKLFNDRRSLAKEPKEMTLTEEYCKSEFRLTLFHHLNSALIVFVLFHAMPRFSPNAYQLPFNCYVFFMPPDSFMFAWELNYLAQTVIITFIGLLIAIFVPFPYVMMNQSCWLVDMALVTVDNLNTDLQTDENKSDSERDAKTNENLKNLAERCEKFVEWQNEVQDLLSWYFNLEFQVQSLIVCFSIYVLSFSFEVVYLLVLIFCATQLSFLCWMGERVTSRIGQLSFDSTENWYLMTPPQRKTLQMIVHWTQNMKGFSGIFKDVSLETCKEIFEASYSFYAFLRSVNAN